MAKPDIVFVPGLWEGPQVFDACAKDLRLEGYEVHLVSLLSTGSRSREESQSLNLYDDVAHVRFVLEKLIHREREIVLVLHSAGGFIGSHAIEGLSATARQKQGLKGGVVRLAFLAAVLLPEGDTPPMMQFFSILGDKILCKSPRQLLFNDLKSDEDAAKYLESLQHQPGQYWEVAVTYGGWKDVPSSYLFCKNDALITPDVQRKCSQLAGSDPIVECDAGHMAPLTATQVVTEFVRRAAGEPI